MESSERVADFVFAYRIREIIVKRKGRVKSHQVYEKGALFSTERKRVDIGVDKAEVLELGDEVDVDGFDKEVKLLPLICGVDGEHVQCVIPGEI